MGIEIRGLATVRSMLGRVRMAASRVPTVEITLSEESADKLQWLRDSGRDFEKTNSTLLYEMVGAAQRGFDALASGASTDPELPWRLAGEAYLRRVAARLASSGGDVRGTMKALKATTVARKGHARIGVDSGDLLRDMLGARIVVTLRGVVVLDRPVLLREAA